MNKSKKEEKMKSKISNRSFPFLNARSRRGFTVIEVLVGSSIMLTIILLTLSLYTKSNKVSVDQQQLSGLQHDVRAAMYFLSRDIKSIGAGLPLQFSGYFLEGENNDPKGGPPIKTDRLTILGNSDPLRLIIESFNKGARTITLQPDDLDLYPYNANSYPDDPKGYINRLIIILPNPDLNDKKAELGKITSVDFGADQITYDDVNEKLPNGLNPSGSSADYIGGTVHFIELKTYWLDVKGSYPGCQVGQDGYIGQPGVLYVSQWNPVNDSYEYLALAQNIEDLQFQYHGDLDGDQQLDDNNSDGVIDINDYQNWDDLPFGGGGGGGGGGGDDDDEGDDDDDEGGGGMGGGGMGGGGSVSSDVVAGIRSVRILILGKTANPFISFSGTPPDQVKYIYGKPSIADSPAEAQPDKHRRFLLESTAQIRNMSLNIYNSGTT